MDEKEAEGGRQGKVSTPTDGKRGGREEVSIEQAERLMVELERFVDAGIISGETYDNIRRAVEKKLGAVEKPENLVELVYGKERVRAEIAKRAEEIEKRFEGDEEGLRAFLRKPIVGNIDHRFDGIECKASGRGGVCSAQKREFEYATEKPNNHGTWICMDCGRLYGEKELLKLSGVSE